MCIWPVFICGPFPFPLDFKFQQAGAASGILPMRPTAASTVPVTQWVFVEQTHEDKTTGRGSQWHRQGRGAGGDGPGKWGELGLY